MGTNTKKQMDANSAYLPYYASIRKVIRDYQARYKPEKGNDIFCPAMVNYQGNRNPSDTYVFEDANFVSPRDSFVDATISLGSLRGIRAACLYEIPNLNYNPIRDFFTDIQGAHVTFAGHSRGGIGEGLAAFVAVHRAGQKIRSLRVVGLATPAASNLWQKSGKLLPNGRGTEHM
jgi:hypothetical protein